VKRVGKGEEGTCKNGDRKRKSMRGKSKRLGKGEGGFCIKGSDQSDQFSYSIITILLRQVDHLLSPSLR
jgi:hypothetical protein